VPRKVRIARIIARLNVGGPAHHVALLSSRLPSDEFETVLFSGNVSPGETEMTEVLEHENVTPSRIPELGRAIHLTDDIIALSRLTAQISRFKPDIVHTHTAKAGALGRTAGFVCRVPRLVHTFHGHTFEGYFTPTVAQCFQAIERGLGRITDAVVTISPRQHADITQKFRIVPPAKARIVPLGFDLSMYEDVARHRGRLRSSLSLSAEVPIIATVGRLVPIKDHPLLLRAFSRLRQAAALVVVGDGPERSSLERLASELGISRRTHFLGSRSDVPRLLADVDVVALTSKNEGTPVALIEALAAGCIPISTSVGGVPDVLENGTYGRLVTSRDPADFAQALEAVLHAVQTRDLGAQREAGKRHVQIRYSFDRLVTDHVALYRELLLRA
jgi:glycosyltransferase involved in cell wall biosynthesis